MLGLVGVRNPRVDAVALGASGTPPRILLPVCQITVCCKTAHCQHCQPMGRTY